jgi:hypothetical protein
LIGSLIFLLVDVNKSLNALKLELKTNEMDEKSTYLASGHSYQ